MNEKVPRVLIIEDDWAFQEMWEVILGGKIKIISALTLAEAEQKFEQNCFDLDAVVMDACLEGRTPDTLDLTAKIRKEFGGEKPIIAASASPEYRERLKAAGCNYEVWQKQDIPDKLREIFFSK